MVRPVVLPLLAASLVLGLGAAPAQARHGGDRREVRTTGTCSAGARATLKLKADDRRIEAELEVEHARSGTWRVVVVHEGTVAWRGSVRARGGRFSVERRFADLAGADAVSVRATGPGGVSCRAGATLSGS